MVSVVILHDPHWKMAFEEEAAEIEHAVGKTPIRLHHIGSTATSDVLEEATIDPLGADASLIDVDSNAYALESMRYAVLGAYGIEGRRHFRKMDAIGTQTHHPHIFEEAHRTSRAISHSETA